MCIKYTKYSIPFHYSANSTCILAWPPWSLILTRPTPRLSQSLPTTSTSLLRDPITCPVMSPLTICSTLYGCLCNHNFLVSDILCCGGRGAVQVSAMLTAAALGPDWSAGQQSWRWTAGRSPGCCANIAGWGRPATESQPSASVFSRTGLLHQNQVVNNISEFLPTIRVRVGWQPKIEDSGEVNCVIIQGEFLSSNHPGRCRLHTWVSRQQNKDLGSNDAVNVGLST